MTELTDAGKIDILRNIEKAEVALASAQIYFERNSEANAALHGSDKVLYSPLVSILHDARVSLRLARNRINDSE